MRRATPSRSKLRRTRRGGMPTSTPMPRQRRGGSQPMSRCPTRWPIPTSSPTCVPPVRVRQVDPLVDRMLVRARARAHSAPGRPGAAASHRRAASVDRIAVRRAPWRRSTVKRSTTTRSSRSCARATTPTNGEPPGKRRRASARTSPTISASSLEPATPRRARSDTATTSRSRSRRPTSTKTRLFATLDRGRRPHRANRSAR